MTYGLFSMAQNGTNIPKHLAIIRPPRMPCFSHLKTTPVFKKMNRHIACALLILPAISCALPVWGLEENQDLPSQSAPVTVPLIQSDYRIDGIMDEPLWRQAVQVRLPVEIEPGINVPAPQETTAYLVDTGQALLVGFRAFDTEPEKIRAFLRDRDALFEDDFVGILLDTYNDNVRALEFFSNPLGSQADLIRDDNNGGEDASWDAIWNSAGQITPEGYVVEMEIPYTELQMPPTRGEDVGHRVYPGIAPRSAPSAHGPPAGSR